MAVTNSENRLLDENTCGSLLEKLQVTLQCFSFVFVGLVIVKWVEGFEDANVTDLGMQYVSGRGFYRPLMVGFTRTSLGKNLKSHNFNLSQQSIK